MDLIQYFSLTLNSGVNSVMEGYGSVCKRVILAPLFLFLTFKETESTEKEEKLNVIVMSFCIIVPLRSSINDVIKKTEKKSNNRRQKK